MSHGARVWGALWVVYILWGSTYLGIAVAGDTIPPVLAAATRFIAAGAIMAVVVVKRGGTMRVSRRAFASCALVGLLLLGANGLLFLGERQVPIGLASLIIASVPLWVVVERLTLRDRLPTPALVGVGIGFAGVAVLAQPKAGGTVTALVFCVLSAVMWATGSVASARLELPVDSFAATAWEMLAGGFGLLPFGILSAHSFSPSATSLLAWAYLVTFGSVIGFTAYTWLLANAPLSTVSTYAYVNPIVAIVLGVLFRHEHLTVRIAIGAVVVVSGVALVVRQQPPSATAVEEGVR